MTGPKKPQIYCAECKATHDLGVLNGIWFRYPDAQLEIPFADYPRRVRYLKDFCIVDDARYLLRGWLQIPIIGWQRPHVWGSWAEVDEPTYRRCFALRLREDQFREPLFAGTLGTSLPGYSTPTRGLPLNIRLHHPGTLPELIVFAQVDGTKASTLQDESNPAPGTLAHQQRYGVLPRDMIPWFHACQ